MSQRIMVGTGQAAILPVGFGVSRTAEHAGFAALLADGANAHGVSAGKALPGVQKIAPRVLPWTAEVGPGQERSTSLPAAIEPVASEPATFEPATQGISEEVLPAPIKAQVTVGAEATALPAEGSVRVAVKGVEAATETASRTRSSAHPGRSAAPGEGRPKVSSNGRIAVQQRAPVIEAPASAKVSPAILVAEQPASVGAGSAPVWGEGEIVGTQVEPAPVSTLRVAGRPAPVLPPKAPVIEPVAVTAAPVVAAASGGGRKLPLPASPISGGRPVDHVESASIASVVDYLQPVAAGPGVVKLQPEPLRPVVDQLQAVPGADRLPQASSLPAVVESQLAGILPVTDHLQPDSAAAAVIALQPAPTGFEFEHPAAGQPAATRPTHRAGTNSLTEIAGPESSAPITARAPSLLQVQPETAFTPLPGDSAPVAVEAGDKALIAPVGTDLAEVAAPRVVAQGQPIAAAARSVRAASAKPANAGAPGQVAPARRADTAAPAVASKAPTNGSQAAVVAPAGATAAEVKPISSAVAGSVVPVQAVHAPAGQASMAAPVSPSASTEVHPEARPGTDAGAYPDAAQPYAPEARTLVASAQTLEVGVASGTHGWLRVRAEMGHAGEVTASVIASSSRGVESLHRELPGLGEYLLHEQVAISSVAIAAPSLLGASAAAANSLAPSAGNFGEPAGRQQPESQGGAAGQNGTGWTGEERGSAGQGLPDSLLSSNLALPMLPGGARGSGGWVNVRV